MESLRTAQQQFALMKVPPLGESAMNPAAVSRQPSTYLGDGDFETEESEGIPRTPRGSSRASHVSSLAHSHRYGILREYRAFKDILYNARYIISIFSVVVWKWRAYHPEAAAFCRVIIQAEM
jgi:hypothetical protein